MKIKIVVSSLFALVVSTAIIFFTLKSTTYKEKPEAPYIVVSVKGSNYPFELAFKSGTTIHEIVKNFGLANHSKITKVGGDVVLEPSERIYYSTKFQAKD